MTNLTDNIIKMLNKWELKIIDRYDKDGYDTVCTDIMILSCNNKEKIVKLFFHVAAKSNIVAQIVLSIKEIEGVKDLYVDDLFVYVDDKNSILTGDKAVEVFEKNLKHNIIEEFVEAQKQLHFLSTCQNIPRC